MFQQHTVNTPSGTMTQALCTYPYQNLPGIASVTAVYLFGSCVQERVREHSDIDLAFLFPEPVYKADPFATLGTAAMLAAQIGEQFRRVTDVTILNAASIEMAYEIITTGCCVYAGNPGMRLEYEAVIRGMYYDFQPFLKALRANCLARL